MNTPESHAAAAIYNGTPTVASVAAAIRAYHHDLLAELDGLRRERAWIEKEAERFADYAEALNRRVEVEQVLLDAARGVLPLPDRHRCKALALQLGCPRREGL